MGEANFYYFTYLKRIPFLFEISFETKDKMSYDSERVAEYLCRVETLAEDILADKHSMTELDRRRNKNREAMRQLMNEQKEAKGKKQKPTKTFVCLGDIFLKLPTAEVLPILEDDQKKLDDEISKLRDNLKPKMQKLRQLEKKPELKGFDLTPLQPTEMHLLK